VKNPRAVRPLPKALSPRIRWHWELERAAAAPVPQHPVKRTREEGGGGRTDTTRHHSPPPLPVPPPPPLASRCWPGLAPAALPWRESLAAKSAAVLGFFGQRPADAQAQKPGEGRGRESMRGGSGAGGAFSSASWMVDRPLFPPPACSACLSVNVCAVSFFVSQRQRSFRDGGTEIPRWSAHRADCQR
jgi:hypothetical protein